MTEAIPEHVLAAAGRAFKFRVLAEINEAVAHSGVTVETLSSRLGWSRRRVAGLLKGRWVPSLREIGQMAWAIDGSFLDFTMEPRAS